MKCPACGNETASNSRFCPRCGTRVGTPNSGALSETLSLTAPAGRHRPGQIVAGRYKLLSAVGSGGMGVVFKAEDAKLRRTVALKFLPAEIGADRQAKMRFLREAQATAVLDHPNICPVHEIDESDGEVFLTMAFIEGGSIKDRIDQGPLPLIEVLGIASQVAEGLRAAHDKGIIHRDIKPANIMLSHAGQVRITDFGLASVEGGVDLTRPQAVLGTPAYMSPEQVRGERTDGRTDVWSFGCLLFEMTTGRRPFLGEHGRAVANEILNEAPPDPVSLRAEFPTGLAEVVLKCLSKDPSDRYPDFESVLEALGSERIGPQGQPPPRGARQAKKPIPPGYPDSLVTLGDHIRKRRLDLKLTIKELGRRLGADDTTIYLWETNRAKPAIAHVSKIIQFLGYDPGISAIKTIGDTIRSFRRIHGFSQRRLGALTGIDFTAIGTWERGKHKPTKKQLDKLRTFFVSFKKP